AYFYNETEQKFAETGVYTIGKTFKENESGFNYLDSIKAFQIIGQTDLLKSTIEIIDPAKITGDTYEITFGEQDYFLDSDGKWKRTNLQDSVGNSLSKTGDLTGSKIIPLPTTYAPNNTYNIHFVLDLQAVDFDYSDGVRITFPNNIVINSASHVVGNAYSVTIPAVINGQTVTWGNNDTTGDGEFLGGEDFAVNINASGVELNFSVDYEIYDDGWANIYAVGGEILHASGTATLTGEVGYDIRTVNYWKLFNKTKQKDLLNYQTVISGKDLLTNEPAPYGYEPIVDGFRIKLDGTFDAPINFQNVELTQDPNGRNNLSTYGSAGTTQIDISNYTIFPGMVSSWAFDNFGVGTTDKAQLSQDYELRFTGVLDTNVVNGQTQISVKSGGSMATCFRFTEGLIYHPLNTTGKDEAFLVRIPFEVWNVEDPSNPYQVNLTFRDRLQQSTSEIFYSWNLVNRMYGIIVNSPYNPNQPIQVDNGPDEFNSLATWVLVFYETNYDVGQVVKVTYSNPILLTDKLTFTTDYLSDVSNSDILPNKYELYQNYPNPFNPSTTLSFAIPNEGNVSLIIYDVLGTKVAELENGFKSAGNYSYLFDASNLTSGIYFYIISANNFTATKKMLIMK
ncbi:MAG: T9SS type A sorting domain-containing protein, partial [Ignavibacteriae bacterium]|nr:T9SS type A sorting domain-containing protein [Ignavibacteriota bacterium]